jgi:hypothetical protein
MKTQINIPNKHLPLFIERCEMVQIFYHQIEARENDTRYELLYEIPSQLYYLGLGVGMDVAHKIHIESLDELKNGN